MFGSSEENIYLCTRKSGNPGAIFYMVPVVQLVRASDCGSECRRFESVRAPKIKACRSNTYKLFCLLFQIIILS